MKCEACENQSSLFTRFESHSGVLMDGHRSFFARRQSSVILLWVCLFSCHTAWRNNDTGLNICIVLFKGTMKSLIWACTARKSNKEAFTSRFLEGNQVVKRSLLGRGEGSRAAPCGSFSCFLVIWDTHISWCVPWWGWHSGLCHKPQRKFRDFKSPECPNVTFPFPTAILSFVHCHLQQCSHLVCEQWPVLDEAVSSQTPPQQHLTTLENLVWTWHQLSCYQQPQRQKLGWQVGRFVYICTLKRAIPADHWWCMTQSPSSTDLCSCQISLFSLGNCHRNLTCTAALSHYKKIRTSGTLKS